VPVPVPVPVDWKLELVPVPVSDVDRAKDCYIDKAGFNADHDHQGNANLRFCLGLAPCQPRVFPRFDEFAPI
jgi:hypothetical protein